MAAPKVVLGAEGRAAKASVKKIGKASP